MKPNAEAQRKVEVEVDFNDVFDELVLEIANLKRENAIHKARNRALEQRLNGNASPSINA